MILLTIHVNFEYCYGIKKLECDFEFNDNVHVIAVYASNGMMKSSFAKTFRDLQKNTDTIDKIYPDANSIREIKRIKNNNSEDIGQDEVYVTIPFEHEYNEDSVSTILADHDKRKEYADAHKKIDVYKKKFISVLATHSKYSSERTESIINETFGIKDFYDIFKHVKDKINENNTALSKISHKIIFDQKVQLFLKSKEVSQYISEYLEKYNSIMENSKYLKKKFDYYNATLVNENLHKTDFFNAKHSINLFDGENKQLIEDMEAFDNVLNEELKPLFDDEKNKNAWTSMDKKAAKNISLRQFKSHIKEYPVIQLKLADMNEFSKEIWISYFSKYKSMFDELLIEHASSKHKIKKIVDAVNTEQNFWHEIIKTYNTRFHVPFEVSISNQLDVILKDEVPFLEFKHVDRTGNRSKAIEKDDLNKNLSSGEKKHCIF